MKVYHSGPTATSSRSVLRLAGMCLPFFLLVLTGCSSALEPKEYMQWVESYDNPLHLKCQAGAYVFDLQYKPAPYLVMQQEGAFSPAALQQDTASGSMQYYTLTLGLANGKGDFLDYQVTTVAEQQEKLYYFSYTFQNDIYILENGRKLPCLLFHFERSYDLKPTRTFVLGFENPSRGAMPTTVVIDSPGLQTGPVQFQINKTNTPTIKS